MGEVQLVLPGGEPVIRQHRVHQLITLLEPGPGSVPRVLCLCDWSYADGPAGGRGQAFHQPCLPAVVDAPLAGFLAVIVAGGVQGDGEIRHVVAEVGGFQGDLGPVEGLEGQGKPLHPVQDRPGELPRTVEEGLPQPGLGLGLVPGDLPGTPIGFALQEMPGAFLGIAPLPVVGVVGVGGEVLLVPGEPQGRFGGEVLQGGGGDEGVALGAPGPQEGPWKGDEEGGGKAGGRSEHGSSRRTGSRAGLDAKSAPSVP
jgi:hypothetical protein